ncbi:MAG: contractile injection system tape measure protein [Mongoliitalea sp.]
MKDNTVVIQKLEFEIQMKSSMTSKQLMKYSEQFVHRYVLPLLEKLLKSYAIENHVQLATVNLDLKIPENRFLSSNPASFLLELESNLKRQLELFLSKPTFPEKEQPPTVRLLEVFSHFLKYGNLPWYVPKNYDLQDELKNLLLTAEKNMEARFLVSELQPILLKDSRSFQRMIFQLDDQLLFQLLNLGQLKSVIHPAILQRRLNRTNRKWLWSVIFYASWYYPKSSKTILTWLKPTLQGISTRQLKAFAPLLASIFQRDFSNHINMAADMGDMDDRGIFVQLLQGKAIDSTSVDIKKPSQKLNKELDRPETESAMQEVSATIDLYVPNAGLVIIHPFIRQYFKTLGYLDEALQMIEFSKDKAVQALHFLGSGKYEVMENQLILEKLLCGLPANYPVERFGELDTQVKDEADSLLKAIIQHWQRLKSTSPDGLREMFIHRDGKLELDKPRLIVERKAQDLLMDSLPWGISVIKLPWMRDTLFVNW